MRGNEIRNIALDSKSKGNQMYSVPRRKTTYAHCGMHALLKQEEGEGVLLQ